MGILCRLKTIVLIELYLIEKLILSVAAAAVGRRKERDWNCAAEEILTEWNETGMGKLARQIDAVVPVGVRDHRVTAGVAAGIETVAAGIEVVAAVVEIETAAAVASAGTAGKDGKIEERLRQELMRVDGLLLDVRLIEGQLLQREWKLAVQDAQDEQEEVTARLADEPVGVVPLEEVL